MKKVILHIGPGKCGSSSIQHFFASNNNPCTQKTCYRLLNPSMVEELERGQIGINHPSLSFLEPHNIMTKDYDSLILSHEVLFKYPYALRKLCQKIRLLTKDIRIIGYSRKQSDFIVSAYSQWLFKSPERIREISDILEQLDIPELLFTGLERHVIASIENNFYSARQLSGHTIFNWNRSYEMISQAVQDLDVSVMCGVLPRKRHANNLIKDFCNKAGLTIRQEVDVEWGHTIRNESFHPLLVEAANNAVVLGMEMPERRSATAIIDSLSLEMNSLASEQSKFVSELMLYIDGFYHESNMIFCKSHKLPIEYFKPERHIDKDHVIEIIKKETCRRRSNMGETISYYRNLASEITMLCINIKSAELRGDYHNT